MVPVSHKGKCDMPDLPLNLFYLYDRSSFQNKCRFFLGCRIHLSASFVFRENDRNLQVLLNMNHGDSDEITTPGTDDGWITVKSKKKKDKTERTMSRVNAGKNESILYTNGMRVNGQRNDNRVSFAADSL